MTLSPIVLFVYNRPYHTKQTIEALQKNQLATESKLFIYSDAAKNENAQEKVNEVREYIKTIDGFEQITVIERKNNFGLVKSIIEGVTSIINEYGKIIVLEDDLVTSPYFLKFMNEALEFYKDKKKVWHVSGWNYPIDTNNLEDVFLWRVMNCWGWATWKDRWKHYEKDVDKTISEFSKADIKRFNIGGSEDFFGQVTANKEKRINTWAIFWYVSIFKNKGLCLNPTQTFVENIGNDGSGIHCGAADIYKGDISLNQRIDFTNKISENKTAIKYLRVFYKSFRKSLLERIINKMKRVLT